MKLDYEGLKVDEIEQTADKKGFIISWSAPKVGFGEVVIEFTEGGRILADTECMCSKDDTEFIRLVLCALIDLDGDMDTEIKVFIKKCFMSSICDIEVIG